MNDIGLSRPPFELTDDDLYLFNEGSHLRLYDKMGSHPTSEGGVRGTRFAVWAPGAGYVSVIGNFNGWDKASHPLKVRGQSGIWEGFIPNIGHGECYKYHVSSAVTYYSADKADPFAFHAETPPRQGSIVWDTAYEWGDTEWMANRRRANGLKAPMSIYEVHLGSWRHIDGRSMSYREAAPLLADHVQAMGFTHVEFLPLTEHPFYGSWGYQTTGYFAATSRFGTPQDLMFLIDHLHQKGIGVILDWVPSHFPNDEHGLAYFDGSHLYEHADPRQGFHPDWKSCIFNYGRHEVRSFLLSSALFWLDKYHIDGIRVDAVASMLYLDYSRKAGEWIPNQYGGNENLEAISLLRRMNEEVYRHFPDTQTIAEESTAWPMVSRPVYAGGLGFGMKWDMGWMHDTLRYIERDPIHRRHHQNEITFRMIYAFNENYVLPLSHDEVVHGKGSIIAKMPGDPWQQFANIRVVYAYQWSQPGKKLLFMGDEWAMGREWNHDSQLDWHQSSEYWHAGVLKLVSNLNHVYRREPALHEEDFTKDGFEWVDTGDSEASILSYLRKSSGGDAILIICNFTPVPRIDYRVGVPFGGWWAELVNSDAREYGGSGHGNMGGTHAEQIPWQGRASSLRLTIPPLSVTYLKGTR